MELARLVQVMELARSIGASTVGVPHTTIEDAERAGLRNTVCF